MSSLLCNRILIAVIVENHVSQRQDVENGSRLFSSFVKILEYSVLTLIQNMEIWSYPKHILRPPSFAISSRWSPSSMDKADSPGLFTKGFSPSQFRGLSWLGSKAQTLLKDEIGDDAPAGRNKALPQSLSKPLLMFETCQKSQYSLVTSIIPIWLRMQTLYLPTWT